MNHVPPVLSSTSIVLSTEDQVIKAETIRALDYVGSGYSFASANNDNEKFRLMFPDSTIAKAHKQIETKIAYVIQHGIAPYIKEKVLAEVCDKPFAFKFVETTTEQIKKQNDGYVQYWSSETQSDC